MKKDGGCVSAVLELSLPWMGIQMCSSSKVIVELRSAEFIGHFVENEFLIFVERFGIAFRIEGLFTCKENGEITLSLSCSFQVAEAGEPDHFCCRKKKDVLA